MMKTKKSNVKPSKPSKEKSKKYIETIEEYLEKNPISFVIHLN